MKVLGFSIYKTKELDPLINNSNELNTQNKQLQQKIRELENNLRVCNQLLDASQHSVIQLSRR